MARKKGSGNPPGKRSQEAIERYRTKTTRRGRQRIILAIAAMSVIAILITYAFIASQPPYPARTPPEGSISVPVLSGQAVQHIHAHLDIFIEGSHIAVPSNVGSLPPGRLYALHTHEPDGVIHIEPTVVGQTFTLQQFFQVWGWPLDSNHIFDKTGAVTLYVNGAVTQFDAYPRLNCLDVIVLVYGTPPATIPSTYAFQPGSCA